MKSSNNRNTLILLLLLGMVLAFAYFYMGYGEEEVGVAEDRLAAVQEAVTLLEEVQTISFDFSVLDSPEFKFLKDITTPPLNLPVGRANPFAPAR